MVTLGRQHWLYPTLSILSLLLLKLHSIYYILTMLYLEGKVILNMKKELLESWQKEAPSPEIFGIRRKTIDFVKFNPLQTTRTSSIDENKLFAPSFIQWNMWTNFGMYQIIANRNLIRLTTQQATQTSVMSWKFIWNLLYQWTGKSSEPILLHGKLQ